jgi:hypothetical protein
MSPHERADSNVIVAWVLFFFAHIASINEFLQFIALILAITASCFAIRYHIKRGTK